MKFQQVLKIWWSFVWRYVGTLFVLGYLYGNLFGATQEDANILGNILAVPVSLLYFYYVLNKYFGKTKKENQDEVE
jgi:hypothetical protein